MSRKNSLNGTNLQHRKQPIHFYASSRGSLDDVRNGYCPIDFMTSPLSYVSSPSKYDMKKMSPLKGSKAISLARSPQVQINVDRVMNSSKYLRLSSKIDLLQKNLNRLNGQHQSLKDMFSKSQELSKCLQIYVSVDRLKQKLQQSKTNKYIQQKRYEARFQIIYEDILKKFTQIKKQLLIPQQQELKKLHHKMNQSKEHQNRLNFYNNSFQTMKINIESIEQNANRFLDQIHENLLKESIEFIEDKQVKDMIKKQKYRIDRKIQHFNIKLGQLRCITQYEMYLEKQNFINKNRPQLNPSYKKQIKTSQLNLNELQQNYIKEQINFVGLETLDRLTYQLSSIDSNLVKILEKYQSQKCNKKKITSQNKESPNGSLNSNTKEEKNSYKFQVQSIQQSISQFNHQLVGLRGYIKKSSQKMRKLTNKNQDQYNQNGDIIQSIIDLEEKIKLLEENLNFFKTKCI